MNLYYDKGNNLSLKAILALQTTQFDVSLVVKKSTDNVVPYLQKTVYPVLEFEEGQFITSANEICRYIFRKAGLSTADGNAVDQYLEMESSLLQPFIHHSVCGCYGKKLNPAVSDELVKILQSLDADVKSKDYFILQQLSVVDIVIWSTVYPIFSKISPTSDYKTKFTNLSRWFDNLEGLPAFQAAIKTITQSNLKEEIKESFLSRSAPLLPQEFASAVTVSDRQAAALPVSGSADKQEVGDASSKAAPLTEDELRAAERAWKDGSRPKYRERVHPVLPKKGEKNLLITSALPYVNNVPHLGNIIGCVLSADVYSRYCRLRNYNSVYISGTDEYGTATETKALEEGLTPQQICDKYNKLHAEIYSWFNIDFDYFGRTTTKQQTQIAQDIFWKLNEKGYILKDSVEQLQCVNCNRFLADRFVEGTCPLCSYDDARGDQCDKCGKLINAVELVSPRCKVCGQTPVVKSSDHLFMDLPSLEPLLQKHLDREFESGLWTSNTKQITNSWIRDGLKPRCITRDLKWGTPVPMDGYTNKVFYVWYDAPIGYISITANYTEQWEQWWKNPEQVQLHNFMAKDNVPFHSVIFPSSLLGTKDNWTVVNHLSATEYLNYEDTKFSKSRGVGVFGNDARTTGIPADIWRFYLLFLRPESQDSAFSWDDFMTKNNSELLNNLGNFINRSLMFVANQFGGVVPEVHLTPPDVELLALITRELKTFVNNLENVRLRDGLRNILSISRLGNQYIQANKPWVKVKGSDDDKRRAGTVVGLSANLACLLSVMVQPYMPEVSKTIQAQLDVSVNLNVITEQFTRLLESGHTIAKPSPLFQKLEQKFIDELKVKFAGTQQSRGDGPKDGPPKKESAGASKPKASEEEIAKLVELVSKQGDKVRELKTAKAEKPLVDAEVSTLLSLKKRLAEAQGTPEVTSTKKKGKKK